MMNSTLSLINPSSINDSSLQLNVTKPSDVITFTFQAISGFIGLINLYLFIALIFYELFYPKRAKGGKKLRVLCILTAITSVFYAILQQLIIELSGKSLMHCLAIMIAREIILSTESTLMSIFLWQRQQILYSSKKFEDLRGIKMKIITWLALALIVLNPVIIVGLQFQDGLYTMKDGVCLVPKSPLNDSFARSFVTFSYNFIKVTLVFLFFYPLYKRRAAQKSRHSCQNCEKGNCPNSDRSTSIDIIESKQSEDSSRSSTENVLTGSPKSPCKSKKKSLDKRLSKWLKLTILCVASDYVSATVVNVFISQFASSSFINPILLWLDVGTIISIFCLVGYFENIKAMLFPFSKLIQHYCKKQDFNKQNNIAIKTIA